MDHVDTIDRGASHAVDDRSYDGTASWTEEQLPLPGMQTPAKPSASVAAVRVKPRFAGFTYGQIFAGALVLAAIIWGMWATSKIFLLEDRRVVSVRLAAIVNDFVTAEARSGTPPDQLAPRTKAFMTALDGVLKARAAKGQVVLVGEAVVASSVPDVTTEVVADLVKVVKLATPVAMPPAIALPALGPPQAPPPPALAPAPSPQGYGEQAPDAASNPFGAPSQPVQTVPQQ